MCEIKERPITADECLNYIDNLKEGMKHFKMDLLTSWNEIKEDIQIVKEHLTDIKHDRMAKRLMQVQEKIEKIIEKTLKELP